jgi:hypothetical protein
MNVKPVVEVGSKRACTCEHDLWVKNYEMAVMRNFQVTSVKLRALDPLPYNADIAFH